MKKHVHLIFIAGAALASTGCTTNKKYYTDVAYQPGVQLQGESRQIDLNQRRSSMPVINQGATAASPQIQPVIRPVTVDTAAAVGVSAGAATSLPPGMDPSSMPPNPRPGECYARVLVPAVYKTATEQVLVQDATEQVEIVPAQYQTVQEQVLTSEASEKLEVVPAEYQTVTEQVMVAPPSYRVEEVPAEFDWVEEQVKVKEATTMWKKGRGPVEKLDGATGEILCLVEVPAEYKTVKRKVMKKPATSRRVEIPAKYETVTKRVMVKPPSTRKVTIPAEYRTVPVEKVVVPEQKKITPIPAQYETVTKEILVSPERTEWRRILCETNMSAETIQQLQTALAAAGYDPGTPDGKLGPRTSAAIIAYQTENNLAIGGITFETMNKLGITPR